MTERYQEKEFPMKRLLSICALLAACSSVLAEDAAVRKLPSDLTFKDNPAIPKGGQSVLLFGDPKAAGLTVYRVKLPPGYKLPPHTHPYQEAVTVISGKVGISLGKAIDTSSGLMEAGAFVVVPEGQPHFAWSEGDGGVIQVQITTGPVDIQYVDPADDPRKK
jgi:quercetin dioxygenase-like cupin family protein